MEENSRADARETIGIIGAMEVEVASLKEAAAIRKTTYISGMEFCEGTLGGKNVVIVQCGVGKVNAGICACILINMFSCKRIINSGVAGSLDNTLDIGDTVVSIDAVQHDVDVTKLGYAKGELPYMGLTVFPADEKLRAAAVRALRENAPEIRVYEGRVASGDQFISEREQKARLSEDYGGMCCEMEGAAIAQACYLSGTPFVIIRAISDKMDGSTAVEYRTFYMAAADRCARSVRCMVENLD